MQTHEDGFQGEADVPHIHGVCTDGSHSEASAPRQVIDKVQGNAFKEQSHARCDSNSSNLHGALTSRGQQPSERKGRLCSPIRQVIEIEKISMG